MTQDPTLAWLLDLAEPAVRAQALVDLLGRAPDDPDVVAARAAIPERGMAARVLDGVDLGAADPYRPKYGAPFHRLIALAEIGVTVREPRAAELLELCLRHFFGEGPTPRDDEACVVGNLARAAILMGRADDARVQRAIEWMLATQFPDGGWHCFRTDPRYQHGTLDSWEPLGAFAALAPAHRPPHAVARGVAFFVAQKLGIDDPYEPWRRIHFPNHYYYDVALGLDLVLQLAPEAAADPRIAPALAWLRGERGEDGRWRLHASHPDIGAGADYDADVSRMQPLEVETPGAPSRWATLRALRVLRLAER